MDTVRWIYYECTCDGARVRRSDVGRSKGISGGKSVQMYRVYGTTPRDQEIFRDAKGDEVVSFVNTAVPKVDAPALVTGKPVYTDDIAPKDCLVVKILRSPHAHALIEEVQTENAKKFRGWNVSLLTRMFRISVLQWQGRHIRSQVHMTD